MTKKEAKKMNKDIESLRSSMAVMNTKGGEIDRARTNTVSRLCPKSQRIVSRWSTRFLSICDVF